MNERDPVSLIRPRPLPPSADAVNELVAVLGEIVPSSERAAFEAQAAILRATAKEYYAL
jgi:hypothetical protein